MRLNIARWVLVSATSTMVVAAMLPAAESVDAPNAPVLELFDDNEIPNPVIDGIYDIGEDVVAFLLRMSPF
jgi:hypothetical protein